MKWVKLFEYFKKAISGLISNKPFVTFFKYKIMRLIVNKGDKYNRLTIIKEVEQKWYYRIFQCKCDCWNIWNFVLSALRRNNTRSCGCYNKDIISTHWMTKTKIYKVWSSMKNRCNNKDMFCFHRYGGRGISYTKERNKFENFYRDMKENYKEWLSLDRIDNDRNYNKENCRWVTMKVQWRNRNNNRVYKWKCLSQWSEELGLNRNAVSWRLLLWWSIEKAITYKWYHTLDWLKVREWCSLNKRNPSIFYKLIKEKWINQSQQYS